jgi:hypothetical protein
MQAFVELFDHLIDKGRQILRIPQGNEALIDDDFLIDPLCSGISEVCLK